MLSSALTQRCMTNCRGAYKFEGMYLRPVAEFDDCVRETSLKRARVPWLTALCAERYSCDIGVKVSTKKYLVPNWKLEVLRELLAESQLDSVARTIAWAANESFACVAGGLIRGGRLYDRLEMFGEEVAALRVIRNALLEASVLSDACATDVYQLVDYSENFGALEGKKLREIASAANKSMQTMTWFMENYVDYSRLFIKREYAAFGK